MKHGDTQLHTNGEGDPALLADSTAKSGAPATDARPRQAGAAHVTVTSEGMISEDEWSNDRAASQLAEDRPLHELAASLLARSYVEDQTPDDDTLAPVALAEEEQVEPPADSGDAPPEREEEVRRPLAALAVLGASALIVIASAFWIIHAGVSEPGAVARISTGGAGTPPPQNLVAAKPPPAAKPAPAVKATATPKPSRPAPQIVAAPTATPKPAPTPPTATPTAAPTPTPAPTVKPGPRIHVSDLDAFTPGQRVVVKIYVHDATHNPVAGVTVTGHWSGAYSGGASCVTDATGSCSIRIQNVSGSVTFTVAKLSLSGNDYAAWANHDPDGGSNGTSITVPV